jgi:hypothetical protein
VATVGVFLATVASHVIINAKSMSLPVVGERALETTSACASKTGLDRQFLQLVTGANPDCLVRTAPSLAIVIKGCAMMGRLETEVASVG